jgi:hypothetical protein
MKQSHVFKIIIHIDAVEDLLFYHYPRDELLADGKVPWREFTWQFGKPDGELDEEELHPPTRYCEGNYNLRRHPRDDEDGDMDQKKAKSSQHHGQGFQLD